MKIYHKNRSVILEVPGETLDAMATQTGLPEDGQAQIRFCEGVVVQEWGVGCDAHRDDDASLQAHLQRWRPNAKFLGACITRVMDGAVISDSRRGEERHDEDLPQER